MEREKATHAVVTLCRRDPLRSAGCLPQWVLGLAQARPLGASPRRVPSARTLADAQLIEQIRTIHQASRGTYGVPRVHAEWVHAEWVSAGTQCGRKRLARLMRQAALAGCHRRRPFHTTQRDPLAAPAPDLVQRTFAASAPNQLWIAAITYVPTVSQGFLYLAVILDVFSRRVVGWSMADHLRAELVVAALEMAVWNRRPADGVVHHSDHG